MPRRGVTGQAATPASRRDAPPRDIAASPAAPHGWTPPAPPPPARATVTADDFLDWLEPGRFADLIDGEIAMHAAVSLRHADLLNFLDGLLRAYVDRHRLGFLHRESVAVRLDDRSVFLPDLAFYRAARRAALRDNHIDGAPDLVVEVLSPRTAARDTVPKFAAYERSGADEYWLLDPSPPRAPQERQPDPATRRAPAEAGRPAARPARPHRPAHRFYRRRGDALVEYAADADRIDSRAVPGFFVLREWLDPDHPPPLADALALLPAPPAAR